MIGGIVIVLAAGFVAGFFFVGWVVSDSRHENCRRLYNTERERADSFERMLDDARAKVEMLEMECPN